MLLVLGPRPRSQAALDAQTRPTAEVRHKAVAKNIGALGQSSFLYEFTASRFVPRGCRLVFFGKRPVASCSRC